MRGIFYKILFALVLIITAFVLFISYTNYSEGTRAGEVVKISKKGFIFKTFEGQLNVGGISSGTGGVVPTVWDFSVKGNKEDVIKALEDSQLSGKRVKLYYKEKLYKFSWIGDTKYYVYKVEVAQPSSNPLPK